jgi:hypothetical protein
MKLTQETIDLLTPRHGRSSCSDEHPSNGDYVIANLRADWAPGSPIIHRKLESGPRCNRCYFLEHLDEETENLELDMSISIFFSPRQPKVKLLVE